MGYFSCNAESAIATCDPHYWDFKKKNGTRNGSSRRTHKYKLPQIRQFEYSDIIAATKGFSSDSFLGKGSHGSVYKASLDNGKLIAAVKKTTFAKPSASNLRNHAANCSGCTNCTSPAENEIEILSRVRDPRRFVNLIGFCTDANDNKLIVVEYMPNGSLYDLLHSSSTRPPGWTRRFRFALQLAKAVQTLHSSNPPVIHRDIKSSNVLIDEEWNARLGDFGLALRGHVEDVRVKCTPPAGTLGYLDPSYLAPGDLSTKSDVFSFGILLLEIISGRNAIDVNYSPPSVVDWAVPLIKHGEFIRTCDRRIAMPSDPEAIRKMATLAARCVRSTAEKRPSMSEVVECLKLVRKRIHSSPIWKSLKRRVTRVENMQPLVRWEVCDTSEEVAEVRTGAKAVSRRNSRKVSSVPGVECESEQTNNHVERSKSIGSFSEIKMHSDYNSNVGGFARRNAKTGVTVKMPAVKLSKSRSMGVLASPCLLHKHYSSENARGVVFKLAKRHHSQEIDMSKLEEKLLEKPLVKLHSNQNFNHLE
ncbi:hypothetical protein L6164_030646 [Bauhinia variegata]|uniref:Uncharacterized protein n=1 Tax=Bauhinia variegata TaxID=167791 RepID=A0ACB9LDB3_BAUVA|nr:hypothetical protein L6164_030646 [Bauhinia variegata]